MRQRNKGSSLRPSRILTIRPAPKSADRFPIRVAEREATPSTWALIWAIALVSRCCVALILPNAEQDGYSYAEIITRLSGLMASGNFRPADLFGFWLPLFQFVSAILNLFIHNPIVAGKIVNLICGTITCVLVFAITLNLTKSLAYAWLAFALIILNPLHILYSAACMTDIPHSCLVLGSLWFILRKRWIGGALLAALAECVRIEAWALILVLPCLQLIRERRISLIALAILLVPPVAWLAIGRYATGDTFTYFADRARYQASYLEFYPTRHGFTFSDVYRDAIYFLSGANGTVLLAAIIANGIIISRRLIVSRDLWWSVIAIGAYGCALFSALLFAYVTKAQPVLFPRYGLIFFVLGLPLFAWLLQVVMNRLKPRRLAELVVVAAIAVLVWQAEAQVPTIFKVLADFHAHKHLIADLLSQFHDATPESRCFSDDAAIHIMSGQPSERFLGSTTVPTRARQSQAEFESYLRDEHVAFLVFARTENSLPVKFYPELGRSPKSDTTKFELISSAHSPFGPDLWLYRLRDAPMAR
ncbi:MAG: hypothetical protein JWO45_2032 [Spartobacteria bacterium]|nr:hypothetical protein [Spartobacteria bacterium]